jgi:hypothetical protein
MVVCGAIVQIRRALQVNGTPWWQAAAEDIFFMYGLWYLTNHKSQEYK